ncbi:MAG TPA: FKBP-type peptidyl-prolyl cis-trans isomerase [Hymenobacter sp.]|jgi:peptidylprolyl isomerase|uniref:FKBP-type peptidyl-prolyl cis-trans isomerase n=1 Tax=Hymenobacter sp. TaxID=1898978 RepID=UPI002EDA8B7C
MTIPVYRVAFRFFYLVALVAASLFTTSCRKDDPEIKDYSGIDDEIIKKYLADNNITTAVKQPSGFYFQPISKNPNGAKVTVGSYASVLYTGRLLDASGTVFDASAKYNNVPVTFVVGANQLIPGFEAGIALMNIGDKAELIIPSALAYGSRGATGIPANAVIRFEVEVVDFKAVDDALITKYLTDKNITTAQKQPSGVYLLPVTTNPAAALPAAGTTVSVLYTGRLLDAAGTIFDSSAKQGNTPLKFVIGRNQVIPGFEEGIKLMRKGEKAEVLIPSGQAYGPRGVGTSIAPNTVLRFEVELVDIQ